MMDTCSGKPKHVLCRLVVHMVGKLSSLTLTSTVRLGRRGSVTPCRHVIAYCCDVFFVCYCAPDCIRGREAFVVGQHPVPKATCLSPADYNAPSPTVLFL